MELITAKEQKKPTQLLNKLNYQRIIDKAVLVFKTLHNETPEYLSSMFINRSDITQYSLRNAICCWSIRPRTHGNVFLRFCIVSSNELVVLDSPENSKQYKNAGKHFRVHGA